MDYQKNIKRIACGILFNNSFKLLDNWGEIVDDMLYNSKHKQFTANFFPNISSQYTVERNLYNAELGHSFILTSCNIVFTQSIISNFDEEYKEFKTRVTDYIVPKILSKYNLITRRIGIVYTCELDQAKIDRFASLYFKPEIKGIQDFRFSKKESTIKGRLFDKNNDFINKIFTLGNISDSMLGIIYDYQLHLEPPKADIRDEIDNFFTCSKKKFEDDVINPLGV